MPAIETQIAAYLLGQAIVQSPQPFANFAAIYSSSLEREFFHKLSPWSENDFRGLSRSIPVDGVGQAIEHGLFGTAAGVDDGGRDTIRIYVSEDGEGFLREQILPKAGFFLERGKFKLVPVVGGQICFARSRPVTGGSSVSPDGGIETGTLGGWLETLPSREPVGISNNHVLAECDTHPAGTGVIQPGVADGGTQLDIIGTLKGAAPLKIWDPFRRKDTTNHADVAWTKADPLTNAVYTIGSSPGPRGEVDLIAAYNDPRRTQDVKVRFEGWKSHRSVGKVVGVTAIVSFRENGNDYMFTDQIELEVSNIQEGDSGSLVLSDPENLVGGLVFAKRKGSSTAAFVNPWQAVRNSSGLDFVYS